MPTLNDVYQLHQAGNLAAAKAGYLDLLSQAPTNSEILYALGMLSAQEEKFTKAEDFLKLALHYSPQDIRIYLNLANVLKAQKNFNQAEELLQQAIALAPDYAPAFNNLGILYYQTHRIDQAIIYYHQAVTLEPRYMDAYYNLGLALTKQDKLTEAMDNYRALLTINPAHQGANFQLGCLLLQQEKIAEAIQYFLTITQHYPPHFETESNLAACYLKQQDLIHAKQHALNALQLQSDDIQTLYNLGVIFMNLGDLDQAIRHYQKIIQINPDYFPAHNNLGVAFIAKPHLGFAVKHFQEALRLQPNNQAIRYTLQALAQDSRLEAAPKDYIVNLFDTYADHYDKHLRDALDYQLPELLFKKITQHSGKLLKNILDLGCGTGLCGEIFKPLAMSLTGVDLANKMLEIAKQKNIYTELVCVDIEKFLAGKFQQYELIIAGDVFVYQGNLTEILHHAKHALQPQGLLIFNTEISDDKDYHMQQSGRFAHSENYIRQLAEKYQFKIIDVETVTTRLQNNQPAFGNLYLLQIN